MPVVQENERKILATLAWSDDLAVGNPMIDSDHRQLVALVSQLAQALGTSDAAADPGKALDELLTFTTAHFAREERLMQHIRYLDFASHKAQHDGLLSDLKRLRRSIQHGEMALSEQASAFLCEWLLRHIRTSDKLLGSAAGSLVAA